jgi:hypothetical protein
MVDQRFERIGGQALSLYLWQQLDIQAGTFMFVIQRVVNFTAEGGLPSMENEVVTVWVGFNPGKPIIDLFPIISQAIRETNPFHDAAIVPQLDQIAQVCLGCGTDYYLRTF